MKRFLFCFIAMAVQAAFSQDIQSLNAGTDFVHSIAPTSNRQVVNPGGVNPNAWSSNTSAPTSVPTGLGGFSTPKTDSTVYDSAKTGGLTNLGNQAQISCQGFTPGSDPLRNQECAAVNFLSNWCITPSTGQASILGSLGNSQNSLSAGCEGTYGQGAQQFNFKNQITDKDSLFTVMRNLKANAASEQICTEQTVVTDPAKYDLNTCVKTSTTDEVSCSQYLNMSVTTTQSPATVTQSCNNGTLVGSFCQATSTGTATPIYVCPAGQTLSGSNCIDSYNVSTPAIIATYSCPTGQTLSGSICVQTTTASTTASPNYSCPAGTSVSGSNCIGINTSTATPTYSCQFGYYSDINHTCFTPTILIFQCPSNQYFFQVSYDPGFTYCVDNITPIDPTGMNPYAINPSNVAYDVGSIYDEDYMDIVGEFVAKTPSCPAGTTISGSSCISSATISSYSCPAGATLSGTNCITTSTTTATVSYSCPAGATLSGTSCTQTTTTTSPATPNYTCPAGSTLSGSNCVSANNVTTPATVASYSCPVGATLSGTSCITVVTTPAIINYSCVDGSAPVSGICIHKAVNTSWTSTCGALENSAGFVLGNPK